MKEVFDSFGYHVKSTRICLAIRSNEDSGEGTASFKAIAFHGGGVLVSLMDGFIVLLLFEFDLNGHIMQLEKPAAEGPPTPPMRD